MESRKKHLTGKNSRLAKKLMLYLLHMLHISVVNESG